MAKQIEGVYQGVLSCAKKEFLEKGFKDASLRTIAQEAGTSTGSIYTRFKSKEGLFKAVVEPVVKELEQTFLRGQQEFQEQEQAYQEQQMAAYTKEKQVEFINYIYDHLDVFQILLSGSDGTEFNDFVNYLVEVELEYTIKFLESTGNNILKSGEINLEFLHILNSSYYTGIFEIILHNIKKEDGMKHVMKLQEFYYAGFDKIYHLS